MIKKIKSYMFFSFLEWRVLLLSRFLKGENSYLVYSRLLIEQLLEKGYSIHGKKDRVLIENYHGLNLYIRKNASDCRVFQQIFVNEEYKAVVEFLKEKNLDIKNIVDCGANVGYSSLYLSDIFPNASIISIEPDKGNIEMVTDHIKANRLTRIKAIQKGVWHRQAFLKISTSFRDGSNWAFSLEETENEEQADTEALSLADLISEYQLEQIDLLKMDIEGAERYLFESSTFANSFLSKTRCLAIEIHDEYNIRDKIYDILKNAGFELSESGELTIAYKSA